MMFETRSYLYATEDKRHSAVAMLKPTLQACHPAGFSPIQQRDLGVPWADDLFPNDAASSSRLYGPGLRIATFGRPHARRDMAVHCDVCLVVSPRCVVIVAMANALLCPTPQPLETASGLSRSRKGSPVSCCVGNRNQAPRSGLVLGSWPIRAPGLGSTTWHNFFPQTI
ncbi:hypothetical protein BC834DRAFT_701853 [Gloeopeniophorella convolvens]|nr:hypothetical protein BC834DRAFT_701853 [Gloeopeniophorella convolvens]